MTPKLDLMYLIGIAMIISSLIIILVSIIKGIKNNIKPRGDILNRKVKFYEKVEKYIDKIKVLREIKESLQLKYGVINSSTERKNRISAIKTVLNISVISIVSIITVTTVINIWYMVILLSLGIIIFPYVILFAALNMKLNKLKKQFPEALNIFITKYTSDKNKDRALQRTYVELQNPIRYEFKRLSTQMANKSNVKGAIDCFLVRVEYIWAEVFGELLALNHSSVENIGDELNELGILMAEDQSLEAHKKSEISSTRNINIIVAVFIVASILFNIVTLGQEAINIYFEKYIGTVSIGAGIIAIIGCLSLTFYFEKS